MLRERIARWNREERARGWHAQYDDVADAGYLADPAALIRFDPRRFWSDFLVERLTGAGIFARPPHWASDPSW